MRSDRSGPLVLSIGGAGLPFEEALARFRSLLDERDVGARARYASELAFEELVVNVLRHSGATPAPGDAVVVVTACVDADAVRLRFEDRGRPFDPTTHDAGPAPTSIETAPIGGLGIRLVARSADRFEYAHGPQGNRVDVEVLRA